MAKLAARVPRELLVEVARDVLASVRAEITDEKGVSVIPIVPSDLEDVIAREVERILSHTLHPVINATGVVLHTNLGRAPRSTKALTVEGKVNEGTITSSPGLMSRSSAAISSACVQDVVSRTLDTPRTLSSKS